MKSSRLAIVTLSLGAALLLAHEMAYADDMVPFATGGYATGLRTMATMHMIDTDGDGTVSQEEWSAFQNRVFSALDKGNTGFIDANEFYRRDVDMVSVAPGAFITGLRTKEMFQKMGPDAQGKISREQFLRYQQKIFDMMDKDQKKSLTPAEFILNKN